MPDQSSDDISTKWINSAGGPLILLNKQRLKNWGGIFSAITGEADPDPDATDTDYARACSMDGRGYLARIPVGDVEALVFSDQPMPTAWVPAETGGGTFVRWMAAENEHELLRAVPKIPSEVFECDGEFLVPEGKLILFDAAFAGRNVKKFPADYLSIELKPGTYGIMTAYYEPDERTWMVVHRLVPK